MCEKVSPFESDVGLMGMRRTVMMRRGYGRMLVTVDGVVEQRGGSLQCYRKAGFAVTYA